jgi:hypothetical protein
MIKELLEMNSLLLPPVWLFVSEGIQTSEARKQRSKFNPDLVQFFIVAEAP